MLPDKVICRHEHLAGPATGAIVPRSGSSLRAQGLAEEVLNRSKFLFCPISSSGGLGVPCTHGARWMLRQREGLRDLLGRAAWCHHSRHGARGHRGSERAEHNLGPCWQEGGDSCSPSAARACFQHCSRNKTPQIRAQVHVKLRARQEEPEHKRECESFWLLLQAMTRFNSCSSICSPEFHKCTPGLH